ncbi:hypothetical protein NXS19_012088 [Fusarium pseudograminearum]|nr:hypothetical protein NXS19_012088 [Fusarium pseudograminearum]
MLGKGKEISTPKAEHPASECLEQNQPVACCKLHDSRAIPRGPLIAWWTRNHVIDLAKDIPRMHAPWHFHPPPLAAFGAVIHNKLDARFLIFRVRFHVHSWKLSASRRYAS